MNCLVKSEHIIPVLHDLPWLPIYMWTSFYFILLKYYVDAILHVFVAEMYEPRRTLRSLSQCLLDVPKIRTHNYGARQCLYAAVIFAMLLLMTG